ncbi:hypothetical protein [Acidaminobacterium chupaoyuni]
MSCRVSSLQTAAPRGSFSFCGDRLFLKIFGFGHIPQKSIVFFVSILTLFSLDGKLIILHNVFSGVFGPFFHGHRIKPWVFFIVKAVIIAPASGFFLGTSAFFVARRAFFRRRT